MATYSNAVREGHPTASLTLDGWDTPHTWEGAAAAPEGWPQAALESLINLFSNSGPATSHPKGMEIPDSLGRHIAVLIEDWGTLGFDNETMELAYKPNGITTHLEQDVRANLQYAALQTQRTVHQSQHIQTWYSQGIALFQAWDIKGQAT